MTLTSDRTYRFAPSPADVWATLLGVDEYPDWWPWLVDFDGQQLEPGATWRCAVRPPLPYTVRFRLVLDEVEAPRTVVAHVEGDLTGRARIDLAPSDAGTALRLRASLAPAARWLSTITAAAQPVVRWGHDWVLDTGARQFAQRCGAMTASAPTRARGPT